MKNIPTTTGEDQDISKFNPGNIPPEGHHALGRFCVKLWEEARDEKIINLDLHKRWLDLHARFRNVKDTNVVYPRVGANYLFKIILSFCAILTEKYPKGEIVSDDNIPKEQEKILTADIEHWWIEQELQNLLYASCLNMLLYGTTIEKFVFDAKTNTSKVILRDPFNFFPAPGGRLCNMNLPYCCDAYFLEPWEIRDRFDVPPDVHIPIDADEHLFGLDRETVTGQKTQQAGTDNLPSTYAVIPSSRGRRRITKSLVVEVWVKDYSTEKIPIEEKRQALDNNGNPVFDDQGRPVTTMMVVEEKERELYPGNIRKITICPALLDIWNGGVLDDARNPNINWGLIEARKQYLMTIGLPSPVLDPMTGQPMLDQRTGEQVMQEIPLPEDKAEEVAIDSLRKTWLFDRFPFSATPSMIDTTQWWGFSIIEQLEALQGKQESVVTKFFAFLDLLMFPMLIIPAGSGIKDSQITNKPGIILHPTTETAPLIRYVQAPNPPQGLLEWLQFVLYQMDIVSMSPEVTEGRKPKGVSAASAIIALQDKASTLSQPNVWKVDELTRNRGNAHVSMVLNFGTKEQPIKVDNEFTRFLGIDIIGKFKYYVESGSSAPITKVGRRQQYVELFRLGALTVRSLLEMLDIPAKVIEQVLEEKSVPGALQLLVSVGLPVEMAQQIYQIVMQNPGMGAETGGGKPGEGMQTSQPTGPNINSERMKTVYQNMSTVG
uniref:Putative portal protein n=1 Tax=viral metagenome TaxID=1070528 RepID=A0A6M3IFL2_9ZZZZ